MSLKVIIFWALCATTAAEHAPEIKDLVDWFLSSPGTVFNEKQDIRHEDPSDPSTILGVFAKENISEGELLTGLDKPDADFEPTVDHDSGESFFSQEEETEIKKLVAIHHNLTQTVTQA